MEAPRKTAAPMNTWAATGEPGHACDHARPDSAPSPAPSATAGVRTPPHAPARIVTRVATAFAASTSAATASPAPPAQAASNWVWALACPLPSTEGTHTDSAPTAVNATGRVHRRRALRGRAPEAAATAPLNAHPSHPMTAPKTAAHTVSESDGDRSGTV